MGDSAGASTSPVSKALPPRRPAPGHWERRRQVWEREVHFVDASSGALQPSDLETKITAARTALSASPDARDRVDALYGLLARRDALDDAKSMLATWTAHDPLDVVAIARRAAMTARLGDRAEALRVATGALEVASDDVALADALADAAANAGDVRLSCALRSVHASVKSTDTAATTLWNGCLAQRSGTPSIGTTTTAAPAAALWGDLKLEATWAATSASDLDLALVDPKGVRLSWLTPAQIVGVRDAASPSHEAIALKWLSGGSYVVEVSRASTSEGAPTSGTVTATILGQSHTFPFAIAGARAVVGRVDVTWTSHWVVESSGTDPSLGDY
jgi:hypothetical protein